MAAFGKEDVRSGYDAKRQLAAPSGLFAAHRFSFTDRTADFF